MSRPPRSRLPLPPLFAALVALAAGCGARSDVDLLFGDGAAVDDSGAETALDASGDSIVDDVSFETGPVDDVSFDSGPPDVIFVDAPTVDAPPDTPRFDTAPDAIGVDIVPVDAPTFDSRPPDAPTVDTGPSFDTRPADAPVDSIGVDVPFLDAPFDVPFDAPFDVPFVDAPSDVTLDGPLDVLDDAPLDGPFLDSGVDGGVDGGFDAPIDGGGETGITCGGVACDPAAQDCCASPGGGGLACVAKGTCGGIPITCSNAASCPTGDVCCFNFGGGGATCAPICGGIQLCAVDAECKAPLRCQPAIAGFRVCR